MIWERAGRLAPGPPGVVETDPLPARRDQLGLAGSWACCRAGQGVIAMVWGATKGPGRIGLPGVLVAVLIGTTALAQVT